MYIYDQLETFQNHALYIMFAYDTHVTTLERNKYLKLNKDCFHFYMAALERVCSVVSLHEIMLISAAHFPRCHDTVGVTI